MAAAAGLNAQAVTDTVKRTTGQGCITLKDLKVLPLSINLIDSLTDSKGRKMSHLARLFDEPTVYKMLLRGHAPQSEPFRKWLAC
ncbi:TPA: hypothetical protein ROA41_002575 [Escherichia coli]|uniref:hypothetical protein n=1 Tax=Leclercia sp. W6 TaxID=2282310 RepID=UPI00143D5130|nr:hypothetical protein [Escherichia coli]